ncbi:MAG: hypothetical protein GF421_01170 [Candidatus Aminicenantes bacterium]|nr:hypothetical protein [Candidatus Aminicenantes bacterium]
MNMNKHMKKTFVVLVLLVAAMQVSGEEVVDAIVAVVNEDIITLSDFKLQDETLYQSLASQYQGLELDEVYKESRKTLLDSMITDLLLLQEAEKQEIDVSSQLEKMIEGMKEQYGFSSIDEIKRAMGKQGIDYQVWLDFQEREMLKEGVIFYAFGKDIVVDDTEVINYYRQHPDEFKEQASFELKAIYLSESEKSRQEIQELKEEISSRLESGDLFEDLAENYSDGPYKESRGELGSFKKGTLDRTLEQAVEEIQVGEVTSWIQTSNGWYLLKLIDKQEERVKSFDNVRDEIEQIIFNQKRQQKTLEFIKELREQSYIEIKIPEPYKRYE